MVHALLNDPGEAIDVGHKTIRAQDKELGARRSQGQKQPTDTHALLSYILHIYMVHYI